MGIHQPDQDRFRSFLLEDIDWKPFPANRSTTSEPTKTRTRVEGDAAMHAEVKYAQMTRQRRP